MKPRASKATKKFKPSVLILCEGETEQGYLIGMKSSRYVGCHISIEPKLPKHSNYKDMFKYIKDNNLLKKVKGDSRTKVFCVLDMDTVFNDGMIQQYIYDKMMLTKGDLDSRLEVIESRPCFEFWFLLHFTGSDKLIYDYEAIKPILCKHLPDYCKEKPYLGKMYRKLEGRLVKAVKSSISICSKTRESGEEFSYSLMHRLIEILDELTRK